MNTKDESLKPVGEIIPPELAVRAMRDSGYRNTAYALAELIDNSIQAGAENVEVFCIQKRGIRNEREVRQIKEIAVVDNGAGMTSEILTMALQFGNGTRLSDRKGIGRFGMGLPNSSISQCLRVEVWTWRDGPDNAFYTYLDVDEIINRIIYTVPEPSVKPVPKEWRKRSSIIGTTGTLVLWTKFDEHRLSWRGAETTLNHTETLVGRIHRKFIYDGSAAIKLIALENEEKTFDQDVRVNDPLYLMKDSSTPKPFDKEPMFENWSKEGNDEEFEIDIKGESHKVVVRISHATQKTVPEDKSDRGNQPYGKHAAKNLGLSIVRAGRELDLDTGWTSKYDPTDRWWGIEVEFDPALDEIFGVTNNKQSATRFSQMAQVNWKSESEGGESATEFIERIKNEGDPRALLFPIVIHIQNQIPLVRAHIKAQTKGTRSEKGRHDKPSVEDLATTKFKERADTGHKTPEDDKEFGKEERDAFEDDLKDKNYPDETAKEIADATLKRKRRVVFLTKAMDGYAFFNIEHQHGGLTQVVFNTNHPFHEQLIEVLKPEIGDETDSDLLERIYSVTDTLELLFAAWARYEMEEVDKKQMLFDMRQEWGKMASVFLTESNE